MWAIHLGVEEKVGEEMKKGQQVREGDLRRKCDLESGKGILLQKRDLCYCSIDEET